MCLLLGLVVFTSHNTTLHFHNSCFGNLCTFVNYDCIIRLLCTLLGSQLTVSITADGLTSPATLQAGDNITLECSGSITSLTYSYSWSTTLDNIDGDPVPTNTAILNGFFLHGANTGTHTCTVTNAQFSFTAQSSFEITVQGIIAVLAETFKLSMQ